MRSKSRLAKSCCCSLALAVVLTMSSQASAQLVVSQVYGDANAAGPNGDYVEIFNRSCADVNLDSYSVQVATATGTAWGVVPLPNFVLVPGQYYLIKLTNTAAGTVILTPDLTASPAITSLSLTSGKVAIVLGDQPINIIDTTVPTNACPASAQIIDFVRYANVAPVACTEGLSKDVRNPTAATPGTGIVRSPDACNDTNVNNTDFAITAVGPVLRNSSETPAPCAGVSPDYGACNLASGMCLTLTEAGCDTLGGTYLGDCSDCSPMGACCAAGSCSITIESACTGTWIAGSSCSFNSYAMSTITSNFVDISGTGTLVPGIPVASDDGAANFQLPFPVEFYGITKTGVSIGVNGFISFTSGATGFTNVAIPATGVPNDSIYAMWDDLTALAGEFLVATETTGAIGSRTFIVQWTNLKQRTGAGVGTGSNTFQIKLFENSDCIEIHYSAVDAAESPATETNGTTVGVENATGTAATQFDAPATTRASLAALLANGNALRFCPISTTCVPGACCTFPPAACAEVLQSACAASGGLFLGAGTTCEDSDCPGACCRPDGTCAVITQTACTALGVGAVFRGDTTCPPSVACAESGACCTPDGVCTQLVEIACVAPNTWSAGTCPVIAYTANPDCDPNFLDISATGTELLGWATFDDSALPITLPFAFNFYGTPQTAASVGINGYVVLGGASAAGIPGDSPLGGAQVNNGIYVYGDDLHLRGTVPDPIGSVHTQQIGTSPNSVFIIQWTNVDIFSPTQPDGQRNTFQVKLYEASGVIEMQYLSLNLAGQTPPADIVIGVKQSPANFTEVSQTEVGTGPAAIIFAPGGACNAALLPTGTCCTAGPCATITQAACQLACGIYLGDGTNCTSNPCVTEACCLPQGGCADVLLVACATLGGSPQGPASTCAGVSCPPAGRCCTASGACSVTLQANCQTAGSTWVQGEDCTTLPCILGACCAADGSCSQLTEAGCTAANGIRWTASTPCTPNLCQGRCCAPDGTCSITAFNACVAPNIYGGDGSACSPSNVCQGRCCLPNGTCSVTGSGGCADIGGTFTIGLDCSNTTIFSYAVSMVMNDPDVGGTPVSNVQTVTGLTGNITDLDVDMAALHTWVGDVRIQVEHLGVIAIIYDRPGVINEVCCGCAQNDFDIILDDEGTGGTIEATCNATAPSALSPPNFVPNVALSVYDGMDPNGDWTITAADVEPAGTDTGTLTRWSLHISVAGNVCPVVGCTCFGDMNGDSTVDGEDINGFTACITGGGGSCACANMDHVGGADANDVDEFVAALLAGTCGAP